ncbi:MAG: sterol desaturase [Ferruginibacter sp.]|nr:sterol desaturase [Ferruginibacter sp.]
MLLPADPIGQAVYVFILSIIRYAFFGGIAFFIFYVILKKQKVFTKIQSSWPKSNDYKRELLYSFITFFIFALVPLELNHPAIKPYSKIYRKLNEHSTLYFVMVFPLMLIIHDAYFYFTHRLMHHPKLFKFFHIIHHKSTNPSPWAAFAFNPTEAVIESGIIYVFAFCFPVHFIHIFAFLIFMTAYNVYGHLGFELYPKGFNKHWLGKWINTSVNHNLHHQYFKGNYGLYFTFWDRIMNTLRNDYDARFENVTSGTRQLRQKANVYTD